MRRIVVIGSGGAGKSTFSLKLGERLGLPVIHLDTYFWRPGWEQVPSDEWREQVSQMAAEERWILDGNHAGTLDLRLAAADTVIFLDFNRWLCVVRLLKRWWTYLGTTRPDLAPGCPEHISPEFLRWVWRFNDDVRPKMIELLDRAPPGARLYRISSPRQLEDFLAGLGEGDPARS